MKRVSKEAGRDPLGSKQARISQTKAGSQTKGSHMADKQPTEREVAAAKAARARLYGNESDAKVRRFTTICRATFTHSSVAHAVPGLAFRSYETR